MDIMIIDFGKNQLMERDFRAYDDQKHKTNLDAYFSDISKMGAHVVRMWLFERFEGLQFDSGMQVKDIDDGLVDNLVDVLDVAEKYGLYLYICLMDTWNISACKAALAVAQRTDLK